MTSFDTYECPVASIKPRGIKKNKIDIITEKLVRPMMPINRHAFWESLQKIGDPKRRDFSAHFDRL